MKTVAAAAIDMIVKVGAGVLLGFLAGYIIFALH